MADLSLDLDDPSTLLCANDGIEQSYAKGVRIRTDHCSNTEWSRASSRELGRYVRVALIVLKFSGPASTGRTHGRGVGCALE